MKKPNKILIIVLIIFVFAIGIYGCFYLVQYTNGNTPAQIEAQQRMKEAGEKSIKAIQEQGQWYKEKLKEYDN